MTRIADLVRARRLIVATVMAAATCLALAGVTQLQFEDSYRSIFRSNDPSYHRLEQLTETFGAGENDCLVLLEADDLLGRRALRAIRRAHVALDAIPGVESVVSLHSARSKRRVGRYVLPVLPGEDARVSEERLARAREELKRHPLVRNRLLSEDGETSLMVVRLDERQSSVQELETILPHVRGALEEATREANVAATITGLPALRAETIQILKREHLTISLIGMLLATAASWLLLRRLAAVAIVALPAIGGVIWTLGLMGWTGQPLGMINGVLPALLMVIGLTDAMHLLFHFRRESAGVASPGAAFDAVAQLGGACFLTSLTTGVGFGSLLACQDATIRAFGLWAAVGVGLTFVNVVVLFPLLAASPLGRAPRVAAAFPGSGAGASILSDLARLVARFPQAISAAAVVLLAASAVLAGQLRPDFRYTEHLSDASPSRRAMRRCEEQFGGVPLLQVLVAWESGPPPQPSELISVLSEVHHAIQRNSYAQHPTSLLTLLESLPRAGADRADAFSPLRYTPHRVTRQFVRWDQRRALVAAMIPDCGTAELAAPLARLENDLRRIETRRPGFSFAVTGFMPVAAKRTPAMILELARSLGVAVLVIFAMIAVAFRSWRFGLISLLPNAAPLLATAAVMAAVGKPLQYTTVLAFSICLGVAVDDTIHFLVRYRRELARTGDPRVAVRRTLAAVGPVLIATALLMMLGFGAAFSASLLTVRAFALFSCVALGIALLGDLLILPAVILAVSSRGKRREPADARAGAMSASEGFAEAPLLDCDAWADLRHIAAVDLSGRHYLLLLQEGRAG